LRGGFDVETAVGTKLPVPGFSQSKLSIRSERGREEPYEQKHANVPIGKERLSVNTAMFFGETAHTIGKVSRLPIPHKWNRFTPE
jgi:hypothetical protein